MRCPQACFGESGSKLDEIETFGGTTTPSPFGAVPILQDDPLELFELEEIPGGKRKIIKCKDSYATEIVIPEGEGIYVIGQRAFKGLLYLEKVTIPDSVKFIEDEAFANCPELEIELPVGIHLGENVILGTKTQIRKTKEEAERKAKEEENLKANIEAGQKAKMAHCKAGDTVEFGSYPQDSNGTRKPIEWRILERRGNQALLISEYGLDCQPYNTTWTDVITWGICTLRTWLNGTFLNTAFSMGAQGTIACTTVSADANPKYSPTPGNATTDKVFLLSITEAETYFKTYDTRTCKSTAYTKAQGAWTNDYGQCWWWLRSPGDRQYNAAYVDFGGSVNYYGCGVNGDNGALRPALWITLES